MVILKEFGNGTEPKVNVDIKDLNLLIQSRTHYKKPKSLEKSPQSINAP
jgi:hypothetical protein